MNYPAGILITKGTLDRDSTNDMHRLVGYTNYMVSSLSYRSGFVMRMFIGLVLTVATVAFLFTKKPPLGS